MYSWAIILTIFLMPVIFADSDGLDDSTKQRAIFGARCEARCFAKSRECSRTCHQACDMPCKDVNFYKVKSCTAYCKKWFKERLHYNECKSSCKLLMKLYNTDGGKKHKHLLPDTPKGLNSTLVASKKKTTMTRVTWSYSNPQNSVLFMIETRYYTEKTFHVSEWEFLLTTNATSVLIIPRSAGWTEYRVMSINEYGTSDYSSPSKPVYVMPTRPSPPQHFRIEKMMRIKDRVSVWLAWSKPLISDVPVHRYRLYWSRQLDRHTKQLHSLRVHHRKINGDIYSVILNGLATNTTFKFELQAICHVKGKRLRSKRAIIKSRTLDKAVETKKPVKVKKTIIKPKVMKNSHLQAHGKITRQQTGSSKKVKSITQVLPTEVIATEESTTNESSTTEDENTEQLALGAHNSSSNTSIRSWVGLLVIVVTYLLF